MQKNVLFAPFEKVEPQDDGTLKVYGVASTECRDSDGECIKADAIRKALPDYLTFGAVREMHQPIAAGTAIEANVDTEGVTHFGAHIVDPTSVKKVNAGVLKGFSIGGKVTKRNKDDKSIIEGIKLTEISLVDRPSNPGSLITLVKFDGKGAVIPAESKSDDDTLRKGMYDVSRLSSLISDLSYLVMCATSEREYEGDDSAVPEQLKGAASTLCVALRSMVTEETAELLGLIGADDGILERAAKAVEGGDLAKAGKRFSKSTISSLSAAHEAMAKAVETLDNLGYKTADNPENDDMSDKANASATVSGAPAADLNKGAGTGTPTVDELQKADGLQKAEIASLKDKLEKSETARTTAETERDTVAAEAQKLADQILAKGVIRVVSKEGDGITKHEPAAAVTEKPTDPLEEIRKSHKSPGSEMPQRPAAQ